MRNTNKKYALGALLLSFAVVASTMLVGSPAGRSCAQTQAHATRQTHSQQPPSRRELGRSLAARRAASKFGEPVSAPIFNIDSTLLDGPSLLDTITEPTLPPSPFDTLPPRDTVKQTKKRTKPFLEQPVFGKNRDSLIYDVRRNLLFVYGNGDLTYEDNNLKGDYMIINATTKEIFAVGLPDTAGVVSRPEFTQGSTSPYTMDTITFNLATKMAKIKGVATKDGEGYLMGRDLKRMADGSINIAGASYTTCDHIDHPHFSIKMTKAKMIPGKKIIMGYAYFVMEDVPLYVMGLPGGFFPITTGPRSGIIMPRYGEEASRGFYLREGGYYFRFGDHADLRLTGGIYTLGSWEANAATNYTKRYKFAGSLSATYAFTKIGEQSLSTAAPSSKQFQLRWSHRMDPKARPGTTFSANVNFATSGYSKYAATTMQDHLNTQTNSSIAYSKQWMAGSTAINLTVGLGHSSEARTSTMAFTLPNISFSVASFNPFKRRVQTGKARWYERINLSYTMQAQNSVGPVKESEIFRRETLQKMRNGVSHNIPVKTSFNFFGVLAFTPSFTYRETWNFQRQRQKWDPDAGTQGALVKLDPEFGFFRVYDWNTQGSLSTKLYGLMEFNRKDGRKSKFRALRHVFTPTVGFGYAPDFTHPRYGFYDHVQNNVSGTVSEYSPLVGTPSMSPGRRSATLSFSIQNQLELKVASKRDSTGVRKIPIIEQLSLSGGYDFLRDSMNLSNISITFRSGPIIKNFAIQISATWDPYRVDNINGQPVRTRHYNVGHGKFGRIVSTGWSFGYTFNSPQGSNAASRNLPPPLLYDPWDPDLETDPATRRQYMVQHYYDFSIPWNFGFDYSMGYTHNGIRSTITQTLGVNGRVNLTPKWMVSFRGGYDIAKRRISFMELDLARDLHCWTMSFHWVPLGQMKSYSFHIGIKSGMLADIKYDKHSSRYDNLNDF